MTTSAGSFAKSLCQVAVVGAVTLTARASFADHYRVPTGSMEPTVHVADHIVVSKLAYGLRVPLTRQWLVEYATPARGDVVIIDAGEPEVLLKRVVAVAGDEVEVKDGHVLLAGHPVAEPNASLDAGSGADFGPTIVPRHKLLVLGDNRGNSRDGRYFGFIDRDQVLGRAIAVVGRDGLPTYDPL